MIKYREYRARENVLDYSVRITFTVQHKRNIIFYSAAQEKIKI